jgi:hypothetical protein
VVVTVTCPVQLLAPNLIGPYADRPPPAKEKGLSMVVSKARPPNP